MPNAPVKLWMLTIDPHHARLATPYADSYPGTASTLARSLAILAPVIRSQCGTEAPTDLVTRTGYLVETGAGEPDDNRAIVDRLAAELLTQPLVESVAIEAADTLVLPEQTLLVMKKPGVMDAVAQTAREAARLLGLSVRSIRTFRRYDFPASTTPAVMKLIGQKLLANDAIEQLILGKIEPDHLADGAAYRLAKITVPLAGMADDALMALSKSGGLYLNLVEMRAIRDHFADQGRNPTDVELETIAQTWSEHCSHKTLRGPYVLNGVPGRGGLLKDTIMAVTKTLAKDWCVSVFEDNAGIIRFDDQYNLCFKVETHNHPSAIEPYGGANTGLGGVIRDILGAGLGAKPIANTDVFCVADPDTPVSDLPEGALHPERILRGIVEGVRDYGNRMGIPTVNGAVYFDQRYVGNPLVYCGTVGLIPIDRCFGKAQTGDYIVALGGRTGRDGIHGATFSSAELTTESESISGGAVQIGNAITEKKLADVLLTARDQELFHAVTDCGAGGFSSAVGEMGAELGAHVELDRVTTKYAGLTYTEAWISESQERMVLAVPPSKWESLRQLAVSEDVEATWLGVFEATGRLKLTYERQLVADLSMHFLHEGRPIIERVGTFTPDPEQPVTLPSFVPSAGEALHRLLGHRNIASKAWIIRQYDHEVQSGSVIKPLVGVAQDGPSDAAVIAPVLGSTKGAAIGCGLAPRFGDRDPYRMAASAIDEALRNVVAVGGDPDQTAILDNFCWGNTERPEVFGSLCLAAFACRDIALAYETPFISGKDSLNNEFVVQGRRIVIPPTLLISALSMVPDIRLAVSMDLKEPGNDVWLIGVTRSELGGSHYLAVIAGDGGVIPTVDPVAGRSQFRAVHQLITQRLARAVHDLCEGGLAVSAAEMAFAGGSGLAFDLDAVPVADTAITPEERLFSESNSRFLIETRPADRAAVQAVLASVVHARIGQVTTEKHLQIKFQGELVINEAIDDLKRRWLEPLAW